MKCIRLAILFLLIPLCCVAFAALSKTTTIGESEVDPWQKVLAGTLAVGNVGDLSDSYRNIIYLEIPYADTDVQDGVIVSVEVSHGDDNWILLRSFTTPLGAPETTTLNGDSDELETVVSLVDSSKFDANGTKWFIEDDSVQANSESVRTKSENVNDVTLCHDKLRNHGTGLAVWEIVHEYIIPVPASFAAFRVTIHAVDADADIYFTTRMSKVKEL